MFQYVCRIHPVYLTTRKPIYACLPSTRSMSHFWYFQSVQLQYLQTPVRLLSPVCTPMSTFSPRVVSTTYEFFRIKVFLHDPQYASSTMPLTACVLNVCVFHKLGVCVHFYLRLLHWMCLNGNPCFELGPKVLISLYLRRIRVATCSMPVCEYAQLFYYICLHDSDKVISWVWYVWYRNCA